MGVRVPEGQGTVKETIDVRVDVTVPVSVEYNLAERLYYARVENHSNGHVRPGISIVRSPDRERAIQEVLVAAGYRWADNQT